MVRVVYIAGEGHSGSTLLENILSTDPNSYPVGEVRKLKWFAKKHVYKKSRKGSQFLCSCGKDLSRCELWGNVLEDIDTDKLNPSFKDKIRIYLNALGILRRISFPRGGEKEMYESISQHASHLAGTKIKTIIDSSKVLPYLSYLSATMDLKISVLHIVRDGRAVINSFEKSKSIHRHWLKTFLFWILTNTSIPLLCRQRGIRYYRVSYDVLAQEPEQVVRKINDTLDLDASIEGLQGVHDTLHTFAGNKGRLGKMQTIRYDQSWRREMPAWKRGLLTTLCYLPNKIWVHNNES